jgi:hypothetical protein
MVDLALWEVIVCEITATLHGNESKFCVWLVGSMVVDRFRACERWRRFGGMKQQAETS